ncbi:MAG: glycosyltransferase family 1 protein [Rhodanobacteraceae bacterium]|nr:MAG: glycosyltransferase family 1 protein [Rhodanobacteraceae bacterium]
MEVRRPRVLMLGWEYPPLFAGGLGKASQGLARGLAACGVDVLFVLPSHRPQRESARLEVIGAREWLHATAQSVRRSRPPDSGFRAIAVPARLFPYQRPTGTPDLNAIDDIDLLPQLYGADLGREVAKFAARVARLAVGLHADVVHANDWMTFPAAFAAAASRQLPVFLHLHSTEYDRSGEAVNPYIAGVERNACVRATHVFAVSRYTANVIAQRYGIPPGKITVVYNAPDDDGDAIEQVLVNGPRAPWVVFLGRLTFQKGPDHFLRAAARVAAFNGDARFLVCGAGDMSGGLHALARSLGIADRVDFRGFLRPSAVDRLLASSRVLVMSSVSEPFGLVALEALRGGTPVILSKQSGVREVLGHSLQVDFWDHEKLADQILALLRLPVLGTQLVESGREQLARLSWKESARVMLDTYARVRGLPRPPTLP